MSESENLKRQKANILGFANDVPVQNRQINYNTAIFVKVVLFISRQTKPG